MQIQVPIKEAGPTKYPELVHIVLVEGADGICNAMSASWVMFTSIDPLMLAVSVGFERYTYQLIREAGEFVIAFPSEQQMAEVEFFGTESGRDTAKIAELGTPTQPTVAVKGLLLTEASSNFECRLSSETTTGDHAIFAGEVVAAHVNEIPIQRLFVLARKQFGALRPQ